MIPPVRLGLMPCSGQLRKRERQQLKGPASASSSVIRQALEAKGVKPSIALRRRSLLAGGTLEPSSFSASQHRDSRITLHPTASSDGTVALPQPAHS